MCVTDDDHPFQIRILRPGGQRVAKKNDGVQLPPSNPPGDCERSLLFAHCHVSEADLLEDSRRFTCGYDPHLGERSPMGKQESLQVVHPARMNDHAHREKFQTFGFRGFQGGGPTTRRIHLVHSESHIRDSMLEGQRYIPVKEALRLICLEMNFRPNSRGGAGAPAALPAVGIMLGG